MYAKQKPVKCSVVFFNPLMLVVTNDMRTETNLEVSVWRFAKICLWQSSYLAYLPTLKLVNILNTVFPQISPPLISAASNSFKI